MKRTFRKNSTLVCALLGFLVAGQATAADIRYMNSGDYMNAAGWQGGLIPGTNDTPRFNWGSNTVTLSLEAPLVRRFQMGVDESGGLVVLSGGKLTTTGGANSTVGNNPNANIFGWLTVNTGGEVTVTNVLFVGASATGILTVDGGKVTVTSHLWGGSAAPGVGRIYITNGGSLNVGGNIGLGTINASTPSGGKCSLYVQQGGVLNLTQISPVNSIQPNSVLDISGSGQVTIPGDQVNVISAYTNANRITAYGGTGTVAIDYNNINPGKTTLTAIAGDTPLTETVWNPAANPTSTGKWNEKTNWTGFVLPASITKVSFNVVGAIPCTVTNAAMANYIVMGDNGPGGTLIVTNGGSLTCGAENASIIGFSSNGVLVVEKDATVTFGNQLWLGYFADSEGTLLMNGGTVSVGDLFSLGNVGGKGTARIHGGTLNLALWDDNLSLQGASVLEIGGTGVEVINGDHRVSVNSYIGTGQITNPAGPGTLVVDYNNIHAGKTTVYPLGTYVAPEQATWNPAANPSGNGLWNESANWSAGVCPSNVTIVTFNVADAIPCTITNAASAKYVSIGQDGPGGTVTIASGGSLTCSADNWSAVGRNNTGTLIVEDGASASFGEHLWIGLDPTGDGTLIMNGGTVSVTGMFSCGWLGGKGTAQIKGGTLNLNQWHATDSVKGASVLDLSGTGKVVINGNWFTSVSNYVYAGKITANGGPNVFYFYDAGANKTTISAVLLPAPRQSITAVSLSGGNVSITYQTTQQHTYYLESSPSLSPGVWTPVTGSTNAAMGAPVTFTFPAGPGSSFYRTVSY